MTGGRRRLVEVNEREMAQTIGPLVLVILDGWGIGPAYPGNAVLAADTPVMDRISAEYPMTSLETSGLAVGLPEGQMGNSEVGHLNIGAGFVVYQWITRIDHAIDTGEFASNQALVESIDRCIANGATLHYAGLVSEGGVHSHSRHLVALVRLAHDRGLRRVAVHAFTDGRDTSPLAGLGFIRDVQDAFQRIGTGKIVSVSGRYFAMDRDSRWDRTERAYRAMVEGEGPRFHSASAAVEHAYRGGTTDEFIEPCVIAPPGADPVLLNENDSFVMFNFRADRGRQIVRAIADPSFDAFATDHELARALHVTTMTRYEENLPVRVAFEPHDVERPLARVLSEAGLRQFHAAETEKYAHVTFFLNGGREEPFPGETRSLIPSPKVATYDLQPEMSAPELTNTVVSAIDSGEYTFIVVNYANGDMVGHTGVFPAAVKAIETVDRGLGEILAAVERQKGIALVTADHGNSDEMLDLNTGEVLTAHTTNPVPFVLVLPRDHPYRNQPLRTGAPLSAIAPTVLDLLQLPIPDAMTTPTLLDTGQ